MNVWKETGNYYGYPDCCSTWFARRLEGEVPFGLTNTQRVVDKGTGFIACPSCAEKIRDGKTTHQELITNRVCPQPYPHDGKDRELNKYLKEREHQIN